MLSAFTFGGGYVIVPLMKKRFCEELGWLPEDEILDLVAIGQASPGAIAINTAVLIGHRFRGVLGAIVGALGTVIPPLVILSAVFYVYDAVNENSYVASFMKGMQSGIAAVIIDAVWNMAKGYFKPVKIPSIVIMTVAFCLAWFVGVNVAYIAITAGAFGAIATVIRKDRGGKTV